MKFRVRNTQTLEVLKKDVFLGSDGSLYDRTFKQIQIPYAIEFLLFMDKNGEGVYENDLVVLEGTTREYRAKLSRGEEIFFEDTDKECEDLSENVKDFMVVKK